MIFELNKNYTVSIYHTNSNYPNTATVRITNIDAKNFDDYIDVKEMLIFKAASKMFNTKVSIVSIPNLNVVSSKGQFLANLTQSHYPIKIEKGNSK